MKTGLILEGGAMRGMFTCGVLDVLMEHGVRFDGAAGISAGAVFGCNYKSRQPGRAIRYNLRFCRDARYCSLRSLITTGDLYGADFCYRQLPDELDVFDREAFREDPMEFWIGATDVDTGQAVYHRCTDGGALDMLWMRASASMPLVSRVVEVAGRRLLDGGVADAVPYRAMMDRGYDRNVVILTQPKGYRKKPASPLIVRACRGYPKLAEAMAARHSMYNRQIDELDAMEGALIIRPPQPLNLRRTERDPARLEPAYRIGRRTAEERVDEVRAFLNGEPMKRKRQNTGGIEP